MSSTSFTQRGSIGWPTRPSPLAHFLCKTCNETARAPFHDSPFGRERPIWVTPKTAAIPIHLSVMISEGNILLSYHDGAEQLAGEITSPRLILDTSPKKLDIIHILRKWLNINILHQLHPVTSSNILLFFMTWHAPCCWFNTITVGCHVSICFLTPQLSLVIILGTFFFAIERSIVSCKKKLDENMWRFPKIGVPQIIQVIRPWLSIESNADWCIHFRKPPFNPWAFL